MNELPGQSPEILTQKLNLKEKLGNLAEGVLYHPKYSKYYSTVGLGLLSFALAPIDRSSLPPEFMQGRIIDVVGTAATAALIHAKWGDGSDGIPDDEPIAKFLRKHPYLFGSGTILGQVLYEVCQIEIAPGISLAPGTYDPGDFVAYGIGVLGWIAFYKGKSLIQSKLPTKEVQK